MEARQQAAIEKVLPHVKRMDKGNFKKAIKALPYWSRAREATRDRHHVSMTATAMVQATAMATMNHTSRFPPPPISVERADESDGVDRHGCQRDRCCDCRDQEIMGVGIYRPPSPPTPGRKAAPATGSEPGSEVPHSWSRTTSGEGRTRDVGRSFRGAAESCAGLHSFLRSAGSIWVYLHSTALRRGSISSIDYLNRTSIMRTK